MQLLLIAVGGAVGALLRYGIGQWVQTLAGPTFPSGTLVINLSGSFLIGLLATFLLERTTVSAELRTALLVGVLGAYTTFSTLSFETLELLNDGEWGYASLNIAASVVGGLVAVWAGQALARA